jgi:hypothetical protein
MAKRIKYNFMGYLIEQEGRHWYVLDWDYDVENVIHQTTSKQAAENWVLGRI